MELVFRHPPFRIPAAAARPPAAWPPPGRRPPASQNVRTLNRSKTMVYKPFHLLQQTVPFVARLRRNVSCHFKISRISRFQDVAHLEIIQDFKNFKISRWHPSWNGFWPIQEFQDFKCLVFWNMTPYFKYFMISRTCASWISVIGYFKIISRFWNYFKISRISRFQDRNGLEFLNRDARMFAFFF